MLDELVAHARERAAAEPIALDGDPLDWPIEDRPLIYVAGYYSANPTQGVRNAVAAYDALREVGWVPLVPHVSMLLDMLSPMPPSYWYAYDLALLSRCDAMYVCPDSLTALSIGVAKEITYARTHDIPIFWEVVPAKDRYDA
jgi:hypothetical protein